jgi:hypothetical protein
MFCFVKGPAVDATGAQQPWALLCNLVMKMISFFFVFPCNGALVELNWQRKTEVLGGKTCPSAILSTTNPTRTQPGSKPGLCGERPATNLLSHGTARMRCYKHICIISSMFFITCYLSIVKIKINQSQVTTEFRSASLGVEPILGSLHRS